MARARTGRRGGRRTCIRRGDRADSLGRTGLRSCADAPRLSCQFLELRRCCRADRQGPSRRALRFSRVRVLREARGRRLFHLRARRRGDCRGAVVRHLARPRVGARHGHERGNRARRAPRTRPSSVRDRQPGADERRHLRRHVTSNGWSAASDEQGRSAVRPARRQPEDIRAADAAHLRPPARTGHTRRDLGDALA